MDLLVPQTPLGTVSPRFTVAFGGDNGAFYHHKTRRLPPPDVLRQRLLDASFDTPERLAFARRLTMGLPLQDVRLRQAKITDAAVWEHDAHGGTCHVLPGKGVFLAVTDESGCETLFGLFQFPEVVKDSAGKIVAESRLSGLSHFEQFIDSPDPRFRAFVRLFAEAGYLASERDEYHPAAATT